MYRKKASEDVVLWFGDKDEYEGLEGGEFESHFNATLTPFGRHLNAILTPFERHLNDIQTQC